MFFYKQSGYETLGYIKKDLDNDGIDELIFGGTVNEDGTTIIYDIFTIQDGTDVHAVAGWERNTYYLCTDGTIANEGSSGAAYSNWTYFKYSNAKLDMKETVYTDDKVPGQKYYYATDVALKTETSYEDICKKMKEASETYLKGILDYIDDEVVSSDFIGDSHASSFDAREGIQINGHFFKLISFYDNEWGYTNQIFRLIKHMYQVDNGFK